MKFYMACIMQEDFREMMTVPPIQILCSYHFFKKGANKDFLMEVMEKHGRKIDLFIDSGAFSAYNNGQVINLDHYCNFIKDTGVNTYAGLDVIGDGKKTKQNMIIMEQEGLNPIPTFHYKEDFKFLYEMIEKYDYIALGGMVFSSDLEAWLDLVWKQIIQRKKDLKVHAFGMTNLKLIKKYPWCSVDSTSFSSGKRFGRTVIFENNIRTLSLKEFNEWWLIKTGVDLSYAENKVCRFNYDTQAALAYRKFQELVIDINDTKSFNYLTSQMDIFDIMEDPSDIEEKSDNEYL